MELSIVIPTRDRADSLDLLLERLDAQDYSREWEIVVADNGTTDAAAVVSESHDRVVRIVEHEPGAARARNSGAAAARGAVLLFLDDDMRPGPEFVRSMMSVLTDIDRAWLVPIVQLPADRRTSPLARFRSQHAFSPTGPGLMEINWFASGAAVVRREVFDELGGYDASFPGAGMEDRDIAVRSRALGIPILAVPTITIDHDDWADVSFEAYIHRQRTYAQTAVRFAELHGLDHPDAAMVRAVLTDKGPKKLAKRTLGTEQGLRLLSMLAAALERTHPTSLLLSSVYAAGTAAAITRGVRDVLDESKLHDILDTTSPYTAS